jgi:hypothetical protein
MSARIRSLPDARTNFCSVTGRYLESGEKEDLSNSLLP